MSPTMARIRFVTLVVVLSLCQQFSVAAWAAEENQFDGQEVQQRTRPQKFFIRVETPPQFPTAGEILTIVERNLPVAMLKKRELVYRNPHIVDENHPWNLDELYRLRDSSEIKRRFSQLDVSMILTLSLSLGRQGKISVNGQLIDIPAADMIRQQCPDGRTVDCPVDFSAFPVRSTVTVQIADFSQFAKSLQSLFAKLLHIPEVAMNSIVPLRPLYRPWHHIEFGLRMEPNQPARSPGRRQPSRVDYELIALSLPADKDGHFCRAPEQFWDQLLCDADKNNSCSHKYEALKIKRLNPKAISRPEGIAADQAESISVEYNHPPDSTDVVIKVIAYSYGSDWNSICTEKSNTRCQTRTESEPLFLCIKYRDINQYIGSELRVGFFTHNADEREYYSTAGVKFDYTTSIASEIHFGYRTHDQHYQLGVGYKRQTINSTCYEADWGGLLLKCGIMGRAHQLNSLNIFIRAGWELISVNFWSSIKLVPTLLIEFGGAAEHFKSSAGYQGDGWDGLFLVGGGIKLAIRKEHMFQPYIGLMYNARFGYRNNHETTDSGRLNPESRPGASSSSGSIVLLMGIDVGYH